jgi:hypothetical protein
MKCQLLNNMEQCENEATKMSVHDGKPGYAVCEECLENMIRFAFDPEKVIGVPLTKDMQIQTIKDNIKSWESALEKENDLTQKKAIWQKLSELQNQLIVIS